MKKRAQLLKSYVLKKFPEVGVGFYLSRRSKFVHMGLDITLYSIKNYPDFIDEINKFVAKDLGSCFELVFPQLVLTVEWKFDYIVCRNLRKEKQILRMHMYQNSCQRIFLGMRRMG